MHAHSLISPRTLYFATTLRRNGAKTSLPPPNPYLTIVGKRLRALRKKIDHIASLEKKHAEGKKLDEDQLSTMMNKVHLERAVQELEGIKSQMTATHNEEATVGLREDKQVTALKEDLEQAKNLMKALEEDVSSKNNEIENLLKQNKSLEAELRGSRQDIEALKNAEQENKQSTSIASTGSDGEEIEKLLQLIIGVQHSTKQEGDVAEALHYLCDKVLGRTHHGQSLEFNTILEGSKNSAKLYVSGSEKMFIQGFSYRDLNEKLLAILYPPPPPKILFTFGDSEEWVVDESEAGTTGSTSSQSAPTAPPKSASSTQIQAAAKEGLNSLVFNKRKKGGTTSQASLFEQKAPGISSSDNASFTPDIAENATTHPSEPVSEIVPGHIGTFRAPISDSKDDAWTPYDEMASIVPDSNHGRCLKKSHNRKPLCR